MPDNYISNSEERIRAIIENKKGKFKVKEQEREQYKDSFIDRVYNIDALGKKAVKNNREYIQKYARKYQIDEDLLKSVIFAENARGHKLGLNSLLNKSTHAKTALPMNLYGNIWGKLEDKNLNKASRQERNIQTGSLLIKRIQEKIEDPSPAKVGSVWNYIGREHTNEFGEYVGHVYKTKPWVEK